MRSDRNWQFSARRASLGMSNGVASPTERLEALGRHYDSSAFQVRQEAALCGSGRGLWQTEVVFKG